MKRTQKIFQRDPTKKNFWSSKTLGCAKARNCELQSSQFNNNNKNKKKPGKKKEKVGKFDETRTKKV